VQTKRDEVVLETGRRRHFADMLRRRRRYTSRCYDILWLRLVLAGRMVGGTGSIYHEATPSSRG